MMKEIPDGEKMHENGGEKIRENSREKILETAMTLFSERGYDAVGVSEIAEKAGITKPTLYYFFGSKEGVFREILALYERELQPALTESCRYVPTPSEYEKDVYPVLLRVVQTYFSFAAQHPAFCLLLLSLSFAPPTSEPARMAEPCLESQYRLISGLFREISAVHGNLKGREFTAAIHFVAAVNADIGFWCRGYRDLGGRQAEELVRQYMHGIFA